MSTPPESSDSLPEPLRGQTSFSMAFSNSSYTCFCPHNHRGSKPSGFWNLSAASGFPWSHLSAWQLPSLLGPETLRRFTTKTLYTRRQKQQRRSAIWLLNLTAAKMAKMITHNTLLASILHLLWTRPIWIPCPQSHTKLVWWENVSRTFILSFWSFSVMYWPDFWWPHWQILLFDTSKVLKITQCFAWAWRFILDLLK